MLSSDELKLLLFREVRKIQNSIILIDQNHQLDALLQPLLCFNLPALQLGEVLDKAEERYRSCKNKRSIQLYELQPILAAFFLLMGYFYCPLGPIKSKWYWFSELNRYPADAHELVKLLGDLYISAINFEDIENLSLGISAVSDPTEWEDHYTQRLFKEAQVLQNNGYAAAATFPVVDFLSRINSRFRERLGADIKIKAGFESISDNIDSRMLRSYRELAGALEAMLNLLRKRLAGQQAA